MIFLEAGFLATLSFILIRRYTSLYQALFIIIVKYFIPLLYFLYFFDGVLANDDGRYYLYSLQIIQNFGCGLGLFPNSDLFSYATYISEGIHFGYAYLSSIILCIFGGDYSSAVLSNVFISTFISINILKIIKYLNVTLAKTLILVIFLHPDIIAWSSFLNLKDTIVAWLVSVILLRVSKLILLNESPRYLTMLIVLVVLVSFRYYLVPTLVAIIVFSFLFSRKKVDFKLFIFFMATFFAISFEFKVLSRIWSLISETSIITIYNSFRFLIGPLPFQLSQEYSFLLLPSSFHIISFPVAILGGILLYKKTRKLFLIFFVFGGILTLFYALFPGLLGPRHRYQLIAIYGLFQALGLSVIIKNFLRNRSNKGDAQVSKIL